MRRGLKREGGDPDAVKVYGPFQKTGKKRNDWEIEIMHPLRILTVLMSFFLPFSQGYANQPKSWQMGFQEAATPVMETITRFHNFLLMFMVAVVAVVLGLLIYVVLRYNAKVNPVPSKTTHHPFLEIIWTVVPVIILLIIGVPSIKLIYFSKEVKDPEITLKAVGHQWYWSYEFPKEGIEFESRLIPDEDINTAQGQVRLLSVDNPVYLPVNTVVRVLTTSQDVLHSWAVPSFGVKKDSVPGKLNETWVKVTKEGTFYGQCSELCGMNHGFMPIEIHVVSREAYEKWLREMKEKHSQS